MVLSHLMLHATDKYQICQSSPRSWSGWSPNNSSAILTPADFSQSSRLHIRSSFHGDSADAGVVRHLFSYRRRQHRAHVDAGHVSGLRHRRPPDQIRPSTKTEHFPRNFIDGVGVVHIVPIRQAATRATLRSLFHHHDAHMRDPTGFSPWPHPIYPLHCRRHQDHPEILPSSPPVCPRFSNVRVLPTIRC